MSRVSILVYQKGYIGYMKSVVCIKKGMQIRKTHPEISLLRMGKQQKNTEKNLSTQTPQTFPKSSFFQYKPFTHVLSRFGLPYHAGGPGFGAWN